MLAEEVDQLHRSVDNGAEGTERLLHGTEGQLVETFSFEGGTLGVVADDGGDAVDAYLDGFFDEPLEAGVVLGGGDGDVEAEGTGLVVGEPLDNLYFAAVGVGGD